MPYQVPDFNLDAAFWISPANPNSDPADFPSVPAQLYRNSRHADVPQVYIRIPASFANIPFPRDSTSAGTNPIVECPVGSGAFYLVGRGLWMHRGFPNEYIAVFASPIWNDGTPPFPTSVSDSDLI